MKKFKFDPVRIIGVLFLSFTLILGTLVAKNKGLSLNINERASCMSRCTAEIAECEAICNRQDGADTIEERGQTSDQQSGNRNSGGTDTIENLPPSYKNDPTCKNKCSTTQTCVQYNTSGFYYCKTKSPIAIPITTNTPTPTTTPPGYSFETAKNNYASPGSAGYDCSKGGCGAGSGAISGYYEIVRDGKTYYRPIAGTGNSPTKYKEENQWIEILNQGQIDQQELVYEQALLDEQARLQSERIRLENEARVKAIEQAKIDSLKSTNQQALHDKALLYQNIAKEYNLSHQTVTIDGKEVSGTVELDPATRYSLMDIFSHISPAIAIINSINKASDSPNTYNGCQSELCNITKTVFENAMDSLTGDKFDNYVNSYAPDKIVPYWQANNYLSENDCKSRNSGRRGYSEGLCTSYVATNEQLRSSVDLGVDLTSKGAAIYALPEIATTFATKGILSGLNSAFQTSMAINTAMNTVKTTETCISYGPTGECIQGGIRTAVNWAFLGSIDALNAAALGNSGPQTFNAITYNSVATGGQLAISGYDTYESCKSGLSLSCGVNVVSDLLLTAGLYQNARTISSLQASYNSYLQSKVADAEVVDDLLLAMDEPAVAATNNISNVIEGVIIPETPTISSITLISVPETVGSLNVGSAANQFVQSLNQISAAMNQGGIMDATLPTAPLLTRVTEAITTGVQTLANDVAPAASDWLSQNVIQPTVNRFNNTAQPVLENLDAAPAVPAAPVADRLTNWVDGVRNNIVNGPIGDTLFGNPVSNAPTVYHPSSNNPTVNSLVDGMDVYLHPDGRIEVQSNLFSNRTPVTLNEGDIIPGIVNSTLVRDSSGNYYVYIGGGPRDIGIARINQNRPSIFENILPSIRNNSAYNSAVNSVLNGENNPNDYIETAILLINHGYAPSAINSEVLTRFAGDTITTTATRPSPPDSLSNSAVDSTDISQPDSGYTQLGEQQKPSEISVPESNGSLARSWNNYIVKPANYIDGTIQSLVGVVTEPILNIKPYLVIRSMKLTRSDFLPIQNYYDELKPKEIEIVEKLKEEGIDVYILPDKKINRPTTFVSAKPDSYNGTLGIANFPTHRSLTLSTSIFDDTPTRSQFIPILIHEYQHLNGPQIANIQLNLLRFSLNQIINENLANDMTYIYMIENHMPSNAISIQYQQTAPYYQELLNTIEGYHQLQNIPNELWQYFIENNINPIVKMTDVAINSLNNIYTKIFNSSNLLPRLANNDPIPAINMGQSLTNLGNGNYLTTTRYRLQIDDTTNFHITVSEWPNGQISLDTSPYGRLASGQRIIVKDKPYILRFNENNVPYLVPESKLSEFFNLNDTDITMITHGNEPPTYVIKTTGEIDVRTLRPHEPGINPESVNYSRDIITNGGSIDPIQITTYNGNIYLHDGINRSVASLLEGNPIVPYNFTRFDDLSETIQSMIKSIDENGSILIYDIPYIINKNYPTSPLRLDSPSPVTPAKPLSLPFENGNSKFINPYNFGLLPLVAATVGIYQIDKYLDSHGYTGIDEYIEYIINLFKSTSKLNKAASLNRKEVTLLPKPIKNDVTSSQDSQSNTKTQFEVALDKLNIFMQKANDNGNPINPLGETLTVRGCGPSTAVNTLRLLGFNPNPQEIIDNFYWGEDSSTGADAVLTILQQYADISGAYDYGTSGTNRITDATKINDYTGMLIYGGTASSATESVAHIALLDCNKGDCYSIDSYFSDGKPTKCTAVVSNTIECGSYKYNVGTGGGTPDALFPVKGH